MASTIEGTPTDAKVAGVAPVKPAKPPVSVTLDTAGGLVDVAPTSSEPTRDESPAGALARAKARRSGRAALSSVDEDAGSGEEGDPDPGAPAEGVDGAEAAPPPGDDPDAGSGDEGDGTEADPAAPPAEGEPDPEAPPAEDAPAEPTEAEEVARLRAEHDQVAAELARLRDRLDGDDHARHEEDRVRYVEDPVGYVMQSVARLFGLDPDNSPEDKQFLEQESEYLYKDLLYRALGDRDLSKDQLAQRNVERVDRQWKAQQRTRQAERTAAERRNARQAGETLATALYERVKDQYPDLQHLSDFDARPIGKIVLETAQRLVQQGRLSVDDPIEKGLSEAIRHLNSSTNQRLTRLRGAKPQPAAQGTVTAPKASAAAARPGAPKTSNAQVPAKTPTERPRTLSTAQAAAAPARAASPAPAKPQSIAVTLDPEEWAEDRKRTLARFQKKPKT